jgi:TonB family protein
MMDRRIENIERERQKKSSNVWVFFVMILVLGGLFYYFVNVQADLDKDIDALKKQVNNLKITEKDLTALISDQEKTIDEQNLMIDQYAVEITDLREASLANASNSQDRLELELEIQKKITTISNLENQIIILNNQLSAYNENQNISSSNENQNISSSVMEIENDEVIEKASEIEIKIEENIPESSLNNDLSIPSLISSVPPKYPSRAIQRNLSGEVDLVFDIDQFGKPLNIRILNSSSRLFEPAAINAIEKAVYTRPIDRNGDPVRYLDMTKKYVWKLE